MPDEGHADSAPGVLGQLVGHAKSGLLLTQPSFGPLCRSEPKAQTCRRLLNQRFGAAIYHGKDRTPSIFHGFAPNSCLVSGAPRMHGVSPPRLLASARRSLCRAPLLVSVSQLADLLRVSLYMVRSHRFIAWTMRFSIRATR